MDYNSILQALELKKAQEAQQRPTWASEVPGTLPAPWGMRNNRADGPKGGGWLGILPRSDGGISTEIAMTFNYGGKDVDMPLLVPTLNEEEKALLLRGEKPTKDIIDKAYVFGASRLEKGLSPYAD